MDCMRHLSSNAASSSTCRAPVRHAVTFQSKRTQSGRIVAKVAHQGVQGGDEEQIPNYVPPSLENPERWSKEHFMWDNSYAINNKNSQEPNFDDPNWTDKVTDWSEFW